MTPEKDKLRDGLPENVHLIVDDMETAWAAINQGASADVRRLHVVDHIIPLQGRTVSGLHVETNLRVIEHHENARKHNAWESPGWQRPGDEPAPVALPSQGSLF